MDATVEATEFVCPRCGEEFADWHSLSLPPDSPATCPRCGYELASDPLIHEEGVWALTPPDDDDGYA